MFVFLIFEIGEGGNPAAFEHALSLGLSDLLSCLGWGYRLAGVLCDWCYTLCRVACEETCCWFFPMCVVMITWIIW